jgi:hypothetical protein
MGSRRVRGQVTPQPPLVRVDGWCVRVSIWRHGAQANEGAAVHHRCRPSASSRWLMASLAAPRVSHSPKWAHAAFRRLPCAAKRSLPQTMVVPYGNCKPSFGRHFSLFSFLNHHFLSKLHLITLKSACLFFIHNSCSQVRVFIHGLNKPAACYTHGQLFITLC